MDKRQRGVIEVSALTCLVMVRYERLTLQRSLEQDGAVECPFCAQTAFLEQTAGGGSLANETNTSANPPSALPLPDSVYQHLARCAYCSYTFCNRCKMPWHGREGCKLNFLYQKYKNGDAEIRAKLEASHGRALFEKLAEDERANEMSEAWVLSQTKPCPRGHPVEKINGCNKMVCSVCGEKFCWKCLKKIEGYEHFGAAGGCQLFAGDVMVANEHGWGHEQPHRR